MTKAILMMAACATLLWVNAAQAAGTAEQKCLAERAKAKSKYEQCVETWLAKLYGGGVLDDAAQAKLAKCRIKYAAVWTKLQGLTGSTTCIQARFIDGGTTVTDNLTGLVWEKKTTVVGSGADLGGDRHDVDNTYRWTTNDGDTTDEDGGIFADFLTDLNAGGGFASANGWRLPTFTELETIVLPEPYPCASSPCIDATFGSTQPDIHWSATTYSGSPDSAWGVYFNDGTVSDGPKLLLLYARAVRGGV
jgi:hypothetical protein